MASCIVSGDDWMKNHVGQDPCVVAGELYAPCNGPAFEVNPLPTNNSHYTPGDAAHLPTACSCSWAVYNLLQACAVCQTANGAQDINTWALWITACSTGNTTNVITDGTWYPPTYTIPSGTAIPHWAITDPTTWTNGRFDVAAAKAIADQNIADSTQVSGPQPSTPGSGGEPKHSAPIGAIVGGVIGGLALLTLIAFLVWYARYKTRKGSMIPSIPLRTGFVNGHRPSNSESYNKPTPTTGAIVVGHDYSDSPNTVNGQLGMTLMSPDGRTMVHHAHQLSGDSTDTRNIMIASPPPPLSHSRQTSNETGIPLSTINQSAGMSHGRNISNDSSVGGREAMITPFHLPERNQVDLSPSAETQQQDFPDTPAGRKAREAARERERATTPTSLTASQSPSQSRRMNPPTYEASLVASPGSTSGRPPHNRTISNDSSADLSSVSGSNAATPYEMGMQSPAVASSAAYPPGLTAGARLTLHSVSENEGGGSQDRDDYFGPSAWRGSDRKEPPPGA